MSKPVVIAIDIDDTFSAYEEYKYCEWGEPLVNLKETLTEFKKRGYYIRLYTSRCDIERFAFVDYLKKYEMDSLVDDIQFGKMFYDVLIDDRTIQFNNNWEDMPYEVESLLLRKGDNMGDKKFCECGCGTQVRSRFAPGHHNKTLEAREHLATINRGNCFGGNRKGWIPSEETRQKIGESNRGKIRTEEMRAKLRGREFSIETREKIRRTSIGRIHSEETKKLLSRLNKGKVPNDKHGGTKWIEYLEEDGSTTKMPTYEFHTRAYLDSIGEPYIYCSRGQFEEHILRLSDGRCTYPDFYLPRLDLYIDPKGYIDSKRLEKYEMTENEYPGRVRFLVGDTYLEQLRELLSQE